MPQRRPNPHLYIARAVVIASGEYDAGWWALYLDDVRVPDMLNAALDSAGHYELRPTELHDKYGQDEHVHTEASCAKAMEGVLG